MSAVCHPRHRRPSSGTVCGTAKLILENGVRGARSGSGCGTLSLGVVGSNENAALTHSLRHFGLRLQTNSWAI